MKKQQIKSRDRVVNHGEVFTNEQEVKAMCDLVSNETVRIDSRFLEPACGDGNFLIEVLKRKLEEVKKKYKKSSYDYERFSLLTLGSLYGVDLLEDNVEKCRERLFDYWLNEYKNNVKKDFDNLAVKSAKFILSKNIICGNALSLKKVNSNCEDIDEPIIFSEWSYPLNDFRMQRKDYTLDELLKEDIIYSLLDENLKEGRFLKQYICHYKRISEEE